MWQAIGLIALIAAIIWVLGRLVSTKEEESAESPPAPRRPPASRPRSSASDIERFLEEINRRRKPGRETNAPPAPRPVQQRPTRPRRPRPDQPAAIPTAMPVTKASAPQRPAPPVEAAVEFPRARIEQELVEQVQVIAERIAAPAPAPPTPVVTKPPRNASPALSALLPMLTSRQQLRSALLIHDILGEPRSRRVLGRNLPETHAQAE